MSSQINLAPVVYESPSPPTSPVPPPPPPATNFIATIEKCLREKMKLEKRYDKIFRERTRCFDQCGATVTEQRALHITLSKMLREDQDLSQQIINCPSGSPMEVLLNAKRELARVLLQTFWEQQRQLGETWHQINDAIDKLKIKESRIQERLTEIENTLNQFDVSVVFEVQGLLEDGVPLQQILGQRVPLGDITSSELNGANWMYEAE